MGRHIVALVGLYNETNLGDPILAMCTEWLCKQRFRTQDYDYIHIPLDVYHNYRSIFQKMVSKLKIVFNITTYEEEKIKIYVSNIDKSKSLFKILLKNVDLIIVVGGGLIKYKAQFFWGYLTALLEVATELHKSVIFNAVGVEGFDSSDYRCHRLKHALNLSSLKYISTRDDFETLFRQYFDSKPSIPCIKVADSAVWTSEAFNINTHNNNSNIVGLGIARWNIFRDHGLDISEQEIKSLYIGIALELCRRGYEVVVYTNGAKVDAEIAHFIYNYFQGKLETLSFFIPHNSEQLINKIASFKGVIATRLHSCIISYSLNIPAVGLVWNDKLSLFGQNIGAEKNFVGIEHFDPIYIVDQLQNAFKSGYNQSIRDSFRKTIVESIQQWPSN